MLPLTIYLARPISGQSYDDVMRYYNETTQVLQYEGYSVLHPMIGKGLLRTEKVLKKSGYENLPLSKNHAIFGRDRWMVGKADIVYANLVGATSVSIGTMMELAWASMLGKYTIVAMEDDNVHQHAFVLEAADLVLPAHADVRDYLRKLMEMEE